MSAIKELLEKRLKEREEKEKKNKEEIIKSHVKNIVNDIMENFSIFCFTILSPLEKVAEIIERQETIYLLSPNVEADFLTLSKTINKNHYYIDQITKTLNLILEDPDLKVWKQSLEDNFEINIIIDNKWKFQQSPTGDDNKIWNGITVKITPKD